MPPNPTGLDLKLQRVAARVTATRLASELGVGRTAITNTERELRPSARRIRIYLDALNRIAAE